MKNFLIGMAALALCAGITFGCSTAEVDLKQYQAGGDLSPPEDNVHELITESCGTANEKSGCHLEYLP